ncbi:vacuolar protein sorting-associated protein-like protein 53 [Patellaria atrata CBS 101060]|uniref:Vacuolar protein sorting-associated protein-like protein 53 n=1 Tax=Patellaria atrata CBS 101060 TaxID=1346257 RepID=A0A9P4VP12_9PEZI|nr:vacuolar protein sorting-associated protein-like protein 53 [Patellaria atrata CBS 101060]
MHSATSTSLDSDDFDPLDHLNVIFSHPSTLSSVASTSLALRSYQDDLDEDIAELVSRQTASDAESVRRIQAAKGELADLFKKIESVRERAIQTEQAITEMTADIKRLDGTKRNLTLSMTALKRLQMLTTAYEQLRGLSKSRQYRECAQLLQAVIQLVAHFKSYRSIDQIATLSRNVADLQRELLEQVCEDFEVTFAKGEVTQKKGMLGEACLVMDALGEHARNRLITWYCNTQLREYRQVFRGNDEAGSLDNISRRYSWFNRMLKTYDTEHAAIFPAHWRTNEMLANSFCEGTREDFKAILQRSRQTLDVNLLLSCLQETLNFEHSVERRFSNESRASIDTILSKDDKQGGFGQAISEAFEPYMSLWVESQDKQLALLIPRYRQQPIRNTEDEFSSTTVIASSTELFHFYRLILAQCAKLSTGSRLLELSKTFAKYLDQYGQQVLFYFLGTTGSSQQGPLIEDIIAILNTADYCYHTCNQLEEKIRSRIDEEFKTSVNLQNQADGFMGVASAAVRALVRKVDIECEPTWREMRNTPWSKLESVGDQSTYVAELLRHMKEKSGEILKLLQKQHYARAFCDNLVDLMVNTYIMSTVQCRPISEVGAEQMLLDSYVLKKGFLEIVTLNAEPGTQAPAGFVKRVNQAMSKVDSLLKTLQVRPIPPEALVQAYLIHIADKSDTNFRKILDLKGIRKSDQSALVDLFSAHRASPSHENLPQNSPLLTPLQITSSSSTGISLGAPSSGITPPSLGSGRFDPTTFGSAIINAARDGVDRFGSPGLGVSVPGSGPPGHGTTPPPAVGQGDGHSGPTNLNENLKSIGKFFRRDVSGFGRFGRGGEDGK